MKGLTTISIILLLSPL
ncbi:hypothetical protein TrRE_jg11553, partial [Triparma retinervis]